MSSLFHHRFALFLACLLSLLTCNTSQAAEPDWNAYGQLLRQYVSAGEIDGVPLNQVNYSAWKKDPLWPQVVDQIATYPADQLQTRAEKLSFYINAYNILAIKMVLDHWPVNSIKDAGSLFRPVWKKDVGTLHGKTVTLQSVEDDLLRSMGEPRIHMAIVCASVSCPDLRAEPYLAATLDAQLDDQATRFLNNTAKGVQLNGNTIVTSKIFGWFEDDFATSGGVDAFIRHYRPLPENSEIDADIDYNWNLNGQ